MSQWLVNISVILLCLYISLQLLNMAAMLWHNADEAPKKPTDAELPLISILVAVRNESKHIIRCLDALNKLDYPKEKIQFLIGEDQSEDNTAELITAFITDKPSFKMVPITSTLGKAKGKANVLAHLAHLANGDIYLITDADVAVHENWAREMVSFFSNNIGIVSGTTIVEDNGTRMGRMQEIDWMYFMGLLRSFGYYGLKCTAVGNNMAITKDAYWSTGGYEQIDFSVTEDFKLFKEVRARGFDTINIMNKNVINRSAPVDDFQLLMHQRKRWLVGARELPFYWWLIFGIFGLFGPAIIVLFIYSLKLGLIFYGIKLLLQSLSVYLLKSKIDLRKNFDYLLPYEVYSICVAVCTQVFYFLPFNFKWKNRTYHV